MNIWVSGFCSIWVSDFCRIWVSDLCSIWVYDLCSILCTWVSDLCRILCTWVTDFCSILCTWVTDFLLLWLCAQASAMSWFIYDRQSLNESRWQRQESSCSGELNDSLVFLTCRMNQKQSRPNASLRCPQTAETSGGLNKPSPQGMSEWMCQRWRALPPPSWMWQIWRTPTTPASGAAAPPYCKSPFLTTLFFYHYWI